MLQENGGKSKRQMGAGRHSGLPVVDVDEEDEADEEDADDADDGLEDCKRDDGPESTEPGIDKMDTK